MGLLAQQLEWAGLPPLAGLEARTLDWRFRARGPRDPGERIVLVAIDERGIEALGGWPPERSALAQAILRIDEADPLAIGLALILSDRAGPARSEPGVVEGAAVPGLLDGAGSMADPLAELAPDTTLARAIQRSERVVLPYALVTSPIGAEPHAGLAALVPAVPMRREALPPTIDRGAVPVVVERAGRGLPETLGALVAPAPELAGAAAALGYANVAIDADGVARHITPVLRFGGQVLASFTLEVVRVAAGLGPDAYALDSGIQFRLGNLALPLTRDGRAVMDPCGPPATFRTVSLADLLAGAVPASLLTRRIVLVGATAAGVGDRLTTPFTAALPGIEHIATGIENLLDGRAVRRDDIAHLLDTLAVLSLAVAGALAGGRRAAWVTLASLGLLAAVWSGVAFLALARGQLWLGIVAPLASVGTAAFAVEIARARADARRRREVARQRINLARYFSPAVAVRLAALDVPFTADRRERAVVLFVDLVGFTSFVQDLPPEHAIGVMRSFHLLIERAVFEAGGSVASYMGDGAFACFGVPEPDPAAAARAIGASRALLRSVERWRADLSRGGCVVPTASIGIHAGPVLMGDVGGALQFQFSVIGDTVNVASRLEQATRSQKCAALVSDAAMVDALMHDPRAADGFEQPQPLAIRGRAGALTVWKLPHSAAAGGPLDLAEEHYA